MKPECWKWACKSRERCENLHSRGRSGGAENFADLHRVFLNKPLRTSPIGYWICYLKKFLTGLFLFLPGSRRPSWVCPWTTCARRRRPRPSTAPRPRRRRWRRPGLLHNFCTCQSRYMCQRRISSSWMPSAKVNLNACFFVCSDALDGRILSVSISEGQLRLYGQRFIRNVLQWFFMVPEIPTANLVALWGGSNSAFDILIQL